MHLFLLRPDQIAGCCTYNTVHLTFHPQHWLSVSPFYNRPSAMAFLRLFWEITCILYTAYTYWTVASFWTVARKFQDADVHWHPLQVHTLGRSDSPFLRGGEISPSHRILIRAYIYILWTYILWTESAILEFKNAKVLCCIQRTNPTAYTVWKFWK